MADRDDVLGRELAGLDAPCPLPPALRVRLEAALLVGSRAAAATSGSAFSEVVAAADGAILRAKSLGRDRVLVAADIPTARTPHRE